MNITSPRLHLNCLLMALAVFSSAKASAQSQTLFLKVSGEGPARTIAEKIVSGFGTIRGIDKATGAFIIALERNLRVRVVIENLRLRRSVAAVWSKEYRPTDRRFNSLYDIREFIEEKEGSITEGDAREQHEQKEKLGLDYLEAFEHFTKIRAYPYDKINWSAYDKARVQANNMPVARLGAGTTDARINGVPLGGRWEFVGPKNLDVPYRIYYGVRPTSGRVNAIAYDPSNTKTIYLGGAMGGVWRTTDGGVNWLPLTDSWEFLNVSSIAVHPTNNKIIYVGTGDWHGWTGYGMGVMKTTDGGLNWTTLGRNQFGSYAVSKVLIDPETPNTIVVTTGRGRDYNGQVFRSTDGGASWTSVITTPAPWSDATISAKNSLGVRYYYAVSGGVGGNVYRSADRGSSWTKLTPGIGTGNLDNLGIAASPTNSENAYLLSPADGKVFKTTDHGATWTDTTGSSFPGGYNWSQGWYDFHIACTSSGSNDVVYVGLIDLVRSTDGGANWQAVGLSYTNGALTHNDQQSIAINPTNPAELMFGNDGGIFKLVSNTTGTTITPLSKTLGITQFYHGDWHPTNPSVMIGGTQDNATPTSQGDLLNWRNVGGGDGGWVAINPLKPATQYATSQFMGMYRTDNSWGTSEYIGPNPSGDRVAFIPTIAIDPSKPDNVYAATNYLWRYNAASRAWSPRIGGTELSRNGVVIAISVAPSNSQVIYTGASDGDLYVSSNFGVAWRKLATLPRAVTSISVDPTNANSILVSLSGTGTGHVWQCTNTSAVTPSFVSRSGTGGVAVPDIPANWVERDPSKPGNVWFVGTDIGLFSTTDGGASWANATAPIGLPNVQVSAVKANPVTGYLNVATFGRGMWRIKLGSELTLVPTSYAIHSGTLVQGGVASLAKVDGNTMKIRSLNVTGIGQVAGIQSSFTTSVTKPNLLGLDVFIRSSGESIATEQVFIKNQASGEWEVLRSDVSSTSLRDLRFTVTGTASNYLSGTGKIELITRTIKPSRLGTTPITYTMDCVNVILRTNG
ncbi:MAG: WD40/YVTN/BNR-like repeat-containing protein [Fimbriimonas sp.]